MEENKLAIQNELTNEDIKSLIGNFNYFIGTRMHSNIFATSMKVPTVAIAYEKKTNGIMETVGLSDYIIEMDTINSDQLIEKIDKCIKNKQEIIKGLNAKIPELKEKIMLEIDKVMKDF